MLFASVVCNDLSTLIYVATSSCVAGVCVPGMPNPCENVSGNQRPFSPLADANRNLI